MNPRPQTPKTSDGGGAPVARGPRKKRKAGPPAPKFTHHKVRSKWFQARAAWPLREAPVARLVEERQRVRAALTPPTAPASWKPIGPTNVGGRLTSLVCDPASSDVIWVGAAGGGVWKTKDGGRTWAHLWHSEDSLNVGALAVDATGKTVYAGTGEANLSADSYAGVGLYRSTDAGTTWSLLAPSAPGRLPRRIGVIAIDPFDAKHLRIGGVGDPAGGPGGMFTSKDGGTTWKRETFVAAGNHRCHAIAFHPTAKGVIYATFVERGARSGVWKTRDGGATWVHLTAGLPPPESFERASLAVSPSHPDNVWMIAAARDEGVLGVFWSQNGGATWADTAGSHFRDEGQMTYGNAIAVHPTVPQVAICGGVDLHRTENGGGIWSQVTHWDSEPGKPDYAHADHHALVMPASAVGRVLSANDGGLDVSENEGASWRNRSLGLAVTMYYDVDVAPSDGRCFGGGTQDNGTRATVTGKPDDHAEILGGDGGWMVYDWRDAGHLLASYYNFHIFRFRSDGTWKDVSPPAPKPERDAMWMAYIMPHPSNSKTFYTATHRVWKTTNDGDLWKPVSLTLDGSPVSAIEIAPKDARVVYVGTENGGFFRSLDAGKTWSADLASAVLPGTSITRIETSPLDAARVFLTVANFGHSHVYASKDGGRTWTDIDGRRLPDVPFHALAIPTDRPQTLYVACDAGVFESPDLGGTWRDISGNLPNCLVVDLVHHDRDKTLTAATYGRSLWRLKLA